MNILFCIFTKFIPFCLDLSVIISLFIYFVIYLVCFILTKNLIGLINCKLLLIIALVCLKKQLNF